MVVGYPPCYDAVCGMLGARISNVYFTYGTTIYNPDNLPVPEDIIAHESVHMEQQGFTEEGAALWWGKFLRDPAFRIDQEAEAYGAQYRFICKGMKDRNKPFRVLASLANSLSGPLYQNSVSHGDAMILIKQKSGI